MIKTVIKTLFTVCILAQVTNSHAQYTTEIKLDNCLQIIQMKACHNYINIDYTNSTSCNFCDTVVNIINDELKFGNTTFHYIEDIVEIICDIFNVNQQCDNFITEINKIINLIVNGWSSNKICKYLHMCNQTATNIPYIANQKFTPSLFGRELIIFSKFYSKESITYPIDN